MIIFYNLGIGLYQLLIQFAALFGGKAKLLIDGRARTKKTLATLTFSKPVIWIHAASLGEFEQGRPIIEAIKNKHPNFAIVLTFFSPSGYEIRKNYPNADCILYLPADTHKNAKQFIDAINPSMVFFIKYEFWYHYLKTLKQRNIPVYGVSVIFRDHQPFFKWYGKWYRQILGFFTRLYLQDEKSLNLLQTVKYNHGIVCGDTRFDRVVEIAAAAKNIESISQFIGHCKQVIVAGSTWHADEVILANFLNHHPEIKLIIAPHEVHEEHINKIESLFNTGCVRYSNLPSNVNSHRVMIINSIGLLSSLYKYGTIAYIGGGFGKGIHNTLEAATYGIPVVFGPQYKKFKEAVDLITLEGGFAITNQQSFNSKIDLLINDEPLRIKIGHNALNYVQSMCGATNTIMKELF